MKSAIDIRGIDPREIVWADAVGTVSGIVGQTHTPVVVALAHAVLSARAVATALVVAGSHGYSSHSKE